MQLACGWALVLLCRRWPRITGALLIGVTAWVLSILGRGPASLGQDAVIAVLAVAVLPFLVPAIALLTSRGEGPAARNA